jgi:hypothetical protein
MGMNSLLRGRFSTHHRWKLGDGSNTFAIQVRPEARLVHQYGRQSGTTGSYDINVVHIPHVDCPVARHAKPLECQVKYPRIGLLHPFLGGIQYDVEELSQPDSLKGDAKCPIGIRHRRRVADPALVTPSAWGTRIPARAPTGSSPADTRALPPGPCPFGPTAAPPHA